MNATMQNSPTDSRPCGPTLCTCLLLGLSVWNTPSVDAQSSPATAHSGATTRPATAPSAETRLTEIHVRSSLDGSEQPARIWVPASAESQPAALLIFLHSWSMDYHQNYPEWVAEAVRRDWIYLQPNFRGPNRRPEACGSKLARQDILDAIDYVTRKYRVDSDRIYLAGVSGGGHMAMLMAGHHPQCFSAISAWVGLSDLAEWYRFQSRTGRPSNYARMIAASTGGAPGSSTAVDAQYHDRSPVYFLPDVGDLPLDLYAGVRDGKTGAVPITQTLGAFNVLAKAGGYEPIADAEIKELLEAERLSQPRASGQEADPLLGRAILLRRYAGASRVTIFDGGHEGLAPPAVAWLENHRRATQSPSSQPASAPPPAPAGKLAPDHE